MSIDEAITAREKEIEVPGVKLNEALMKIRALGGWVPSVDVKGSHYILKVHWPERKEQPELL